MSDKKEKTVFDVLNEAGQIDKVIDIFAEASDEVILPKHRKQVKDNLLNITAKLDKLIVIFNDVHNDPEKKKALIKELERQRNNIPKVKKEDS